MKRISQKRRLMVVKYQNQRDVDRLDTCLKMCCLPHVIFKEYEFVGGGALWKIYIDRGSLTWEQVMAEVNRVHATKFEFINDGSYIQDGRLYTPLVIQKCGVFMLRPGRYNSEHDGNVFQAYRYVMEVKETAKSYIFKLLEVENRYADDHIEIMFGGKKRIVLPKDKPCRHAMRVWSDHDFTIYPFQVGVPFYFEKEDVA